MGHNLFFGLLRRLGTPHAPAALRGLRGRPARGARGAGRLRGRAGRRGRARLPRRTPRSLLSPSHTVAGNPMRFRTGPMPLRRDDAWRERAAPRPPAAGLRAHRSAARPVRLPAPGGGDERPGQAPTVGVVVPTHDRPELLRETLRVDPGPGRPRPSSTSSWCSTGATPDPALAELEPRRAAACGSWPTTAHAGPGRRPQHRDPRPGHRVGRVLRRRRHLGAGQAARAAGARPRGTPTPS